MLLAVIVAISAIAASVRAETCFEGDVEISHERDFRVLAGVTCLRGSLKIGDDVSSLAPLKALEIIDGDLQIAHSDHIRSLRGFDALTRVTGSIRVGGYKQGLPNLHDIDGFPGLVEIGGDLSITSGYIFEPGNSRTARIDRVSGFGALERVNGSVVLYELHGFAGLNGLEAIGGSLVIGSAEFATLRGFAKLKTIGGTLRFDGNDKLLRITGLGALTLISGDVDVGCLNRNTRLTERTVRKRLANVSVLGKLWFVPPGSPDTTPDVDCEP